MSKKGLLVLIGVVGVIGLIVFIFTGRIGEKKAAISLDAYPPATVYINGQRAGSTPYENDKIEAGETTIKLVPEEGDLTEAWERTIHLNANTQTFINWEFNSQPELSGGRVIYLEKTGVADKAELLVSCQPDECAVSIDNQMRGFTPRNLEDVEEGEHRILVSAPGYKDVEIMARTLNNYRLVAKIDLIRQEEETVEQLTPTPTDEVELESKVKIKDTPTGWLRVRDGPGTSNQEITKVNPGDEFPYLKKESGWYKIEYEDGKEGWVSASYVEELE